MGTLQALSAPQAMPYSHVLQDPPSAARWMRQAQAVGTEVCSPVADCCIVAA